jgi:acyl-CoA reductase-like NAD-dependent aldehyde dehydrogenase
MATATAHHYATVNPYTGEVVREFDSLDAAAVDHAVETVHRAFGAWRDRPIDERAAIVRRAGELLAERLDRLAALVTLEMGKRIVEAREEADLSSQINRPAASRPELPFDGIKRSGYGRELGAARIEEFADRKLICAAAPGAPIGVFAG